MMAASEELITFQSGAFRLMGMVHRPTGEPKGGIVFCYPFGEERKSAYRAMVHTARAFREAGYAVLRFDYRGCGESGGEFHEATVEGWLQDIETAVATLKSHVDISRVGLLGLRLGATLAACEAERNPEFTHLILWEPITEGRAYFVADLRKKLIREMLTQGKGAASRNELLETLERGEGMVDFDGYEVSGALYAGLAAINLPRLVNRFRGHCLIAQISFTDKLGAHINLLKDAYIRCGVTPTVMGIIEEPFWNRVDFNGCPRLIAATIRWLQETTT